MSKTKKTLEQPPTASPLHDIATDPRVRDAMSAGGELVQRSSTLTITDNSSLSDGNAMLIQLADAKKQVTAVKDLFIGPLKAHIRNLEKFFARALEPLERADEELRLRVSEYRVKAAATARIEQERLRREAEERAAAAEALRAKAAAATGKRKLTYLHKADKVEEAAAEVLRESDAVATLPKSESNDAGRVTAVAVWKFEVVDETAVPREYLKVDESAIRRAVGAGLRSLPGVRIFEAEQLTVTAAKGGAS